MIFFIFFFIKKLILAALRGLKKRIALHFVFYRMCIHNFKNMNDNLYQSHKKG